MRLEHYILDLDDKIQLNPNRLIVTKEFILLKKNKKKIFFFQILFDFHDQSSHCEAKEKYLLIQKKILQNFLLLHHDA
jgi:uncharacterized FlgJ-related protein